MHRYVTAIEKTMWNGQPQVSSLSGVDEESQPFTVTAAQASKHIRYEKFDYFLWDGKEKLIQLMSVAGYVEVMQKDPDLNFESM